MEETLHHNLFDFDSKFSLLEFRKRRTFYTYHSKHACKWGNMETYSYYRYFIHSAQSIKKNNGSLIMYDPDYFQERTTYFRVSRQAKGDIMKIVRNLFIERWY